MKIHENTSLVLGGFTSDHFNFHSEYVFLYMMIFFYSKGMYAQVFLSQTIDRTLGILMVKSHSGSCLTSTVGSASSPSVSLFGG